MFVVRYLAHNYMAHQGIFATRGQAERFIKEYLSVGRYWVDHATWREREQLCFYDQIYHPPIWGDELESYADHYAHVSLENPALIAFTASSEHGEADRQTTMKPGRYLQRFYDYLTPKQIAFYAEWFVAGDRPPLEIEATLHFATTPDEIEEVYANGPSSCMKEENAVRIYGAGDLQLAYLKQDNNIVARALCWPDKKALGRVYPTPDNYCSDGFDSEQDARAVQTYLTDLMRKDGYRTLYEDNTLFDGARILKVPMDDDDTYVMPYLDCSLRFSDHSTDHWVLNHRGQYFAQETHGEFEMPYFSTCDCCETRLRTRSDAIEAWTAYRYGAPTNTRWFCQDCFDTHSYECHGTGYIYAYNSVVGEDGFTYNVAYHRQMDPQPTNLIADVIYALNPHHADWSDQHSRIAEYFGSSYYLDTSLAVRLLVKALYVDHLTPWVRIRANSGWWRPRGQGTTQNIEEAAIFALQDAIQLSPHLTLVAA